MAQAEVGRGSIAEPRDPRRRYQARKMEEQIGAEVAERSRREKHTGYVEIGAVAEQIVGNADDAASTALLSRTNLNVCGRNGRLRGTRGGLAIRLPDRRGGSTPIAKSFGWISWSAITGFMAVNQAGQGPTIAICC